LYVSDHPLLGVEHILKAAAEYSIAEVSDESIEPNTRVTIAGLVTSVSRRTTKNGNQWASITLEDLDGSIDVMFFPQVYTLVSPHLAEDSIIVVTGRIDRKEDTTKIFGVEVSVPDLSKREGPLTIAMSMQQCTPETVDRIKLLLQQHPGTTEVRLKLLNGSRVTMLALESNFRVTTSPALFGDLKGILGSNCL
jgi:DNA polymerase-3 subunit alpha